MYFLHHNMNAYDVKFHLLHVPSSVILSVRKAQAVCLDTTPFYTPLCKPDVRPLEGVEVFCLPTFTFKLNIFGI